MIRGYLDALVAARSIEEVWALHCAFMESFGFDRLLYGFTRFKTETSFGDRNDALILSNHDPAYLEAFFEDDRFRDSPMLHWSERNSGACSWALLQEMNREGLVSRKARNILVINKSFQINAGYTISFKDVVAGGFGAIGLAARADLSQVQVDKAWEKHGSDILLANNIMHLRALTLPSPNRNRLTDRQREVLEWVAKGKTIAQVSNLIGRKPATIEKHLRLAREALNAETTPQAVLKASVQNQIFMDTLR